jgi:N-acetylmuramoyl-L-alanine amidase
LAHDIRLLERAVLHGARRLMLEADSPLVAALYPSPNFGPRNAGLEPTILLLHYTGLATAAKAIEVLSRVDCAVSSHYVIDEAGVITQMVAERDRAWHAGVAEWAGETDINSASIGIEIHNPGHVLGYADFPPEQMSAVRDLSLEILRRHGIRPERVLAHSDVAPARKIDPGEKFDWAWLARAGVGHWVEPAPIREDSISYELGDSGPEIAAMQRLLRRYGYGVATDGVFDEPTRFVVTAFQRHFRPALVDGRIDPSTILTLQRLIAALPEPDRRPPATA